MTDKSFMRDDRESEKKEIEYNGNTYWFEIKNISGFEIYDILNDNLTLNDGEEEIDIANYQKDYLSEVIIDSNIDVPIDIFIEGCKPDMYFKIQDWVKFPNDFDGDKGN
jgi:hypothetical protein